MYCATVSSENRWENFCIKSGFNLVTSAGPAVTQYNTITEIQ